MFKMKVCTRISRDDPKGFAEYCKNGLTDCHQTCVTFQAIIKGIF